MNIFRLENSFKILQTLNWIHLELNCSKMKTLHNEGCSFSSLCVSRAFSISPIQFQSLSYPPDTIQSNPSNLLPFSLYLLSLSLLLYSSIDANQLWLVIDPLPTTMDLYLDSSKFPHKKCVSCLYPCTGKPTRHS